MRVAPRSFVGFRCIAERCEDTCCAGWSITIDRPAYQRLAQSPLADTLRAATSLRESGGDAQHASFQLLADGRCPLLLPAGLCRIHGELGPELLPAVCALYPRLAHPLDEGQLLVGTLACPEAARRLLREGEGLELVQLSRPAAGELAPDEDDAQLVPYTPPRPRSRLLLRLLQDRRRRLADRLLWLGLLLSRLRQLESEAAPRPLAQRSLRAFETELASTDSDRRWQELPPQPAVQLRLLTQLADLRVNLGATGLRYLEHVAAFNRGLQTERLADQPERVVELYAAAQREHLSGTEHAWIEAMLERYVLLQAAAHRMLDARASAAELWGGYVKLVAQLASLKMLLIGEAADRGGLSPELMLSVVQSFTRATEHCAAYRDALVQALEQHGYDTLPYMAVLIQH